MTNIPLHRELMIDARFIEGGTNIHYLEQKLADKPDLPKAGAIGNKSESKADACRVTTGATRSWTPSWRPA